MNLKTPLSQWLHLVYKMHYSSENFGSRLLYLNKFSNLSNCTTQVNNRTTETTIKLQAVNCVNRIITVPLFHHNIFVSYSLAQLRKFHTEHNKGRLCMKSSPLLFSHCQRHCWNCGRNTNPTRELFFCDCGVVQKPACELTYFDLMQLKPSFDIDTKSLGDMFRETQKRLHPDKFSGKKQEEIDLAQQQSALLNKAYNTLLKPLSRAIYLLELQNIEISEKDNFTDPQFLMEIMEINEQISAAKKPSDVEASEKLSDARIEECIKEISEHYKKNAWNDMKKATIKLRYYTTIQERINEIKRSSLG
ncbi:unnamed protein product [Candidula unifasciata]|uniref:J domain-containing protein n=1 Tax=Candidula unifasciata TaxID=100452 RepID=A0A8S3ZTW4_9EUPU|nr:unnamed protein product [Candidula unifasciata]